MSTSASGPDNGKDDVQGAAGSAPGEEPASSPAAPPRADAGTRHDRPSGPLPSGEGIGPADHPPYGYPQNGHGPGPSQPGPYQPGSYQQGPYQPGSYQQGPYQPGSYQPGPYQPAPYGQGGFAQGPSGRPYAPQKSRVVAGVLGILLGSLGIHRFYLGFTTIGVILILMSTVGAFLTFGLSAIAAGIWGLIEGIMILVGSEQFQRDAKGIPLKD
ncbi:TM2 domain [Arthrobacter agilis]|uniref:TM2 domain-containing protein n=1 Tax=Arthrobacter agilis TaxID=37921 RepID=UPI000F6D5A30|nr:TM2 domain-containing protein [Arthrobacter agilis]VDR31231.1 TM2 domain [Arthrobacter agilis]